MRRGALTGLSELRQCTTDTHNRHTEDNSQQEKKKNRRQPGRKTESRCDEMTKKDAIKNK